MISVSGDVSMCEGDREREGEVREGTRARVRMTVGAGGGSVFGSFATRMRVPESGLVFGSGLRLTRGR